jgi:acetyl-CoA carboxylase carboxyl transferase subunit alpha
MKTLLEFEKPIAELEAKISEMKRLAADSNVDVADAVKQLEASLIDLKIDTAKNLTRWQRGYNFQGTPIGHILWIISKIFVMNL